VTKKYQTKRADTSALAVPEQVSVSMESIAADMREGLLALAVGPCPTPAGQALVLTLPAVSTRSLEAYRITGPAGRPGGGEGS
jgi:hypothetical protein